MTNEGELFNLYLQELIAWNKKFNLTAITNPNEIRLKHFEDSILLLKAFPLTNQTVLDVGAGAGFPGIPLKIACPKIKLTLVEATRKKVDFLKHIVKLLKLKDVDIIWKRAEDLGKEKREYYDLAISRAVARLNVLAEYCLPFVKIGGHFITYKEEKVEEEAKEASNAIKVLGGKLQQIKKLELMDSGIIRSFVIIQKFSSTPTSYPRRAGMAKKKPL